MAGGMSAANPGLVDIGRDFLDAHQCVRELFARHRSGELRFEELEALVGEDGGSVLFRLKERCHANFRAKPGGPTRPMHREALFDLAVGSLFHEAMKFRENFYQREVYGPRVHALRSQAREGEAAIFEEFARIQEGVSARLEEGLVETEALLAQTLEQLRLLLAAHRGDPRVARFLVDHAPNLEAAFGRPFDEILTGLYGKPAIAYEIAGRSLIASGYYAEAIRHLEAARERGGNATALQRLTSYALGMEAYLARDYEKTVAQLGEWAREGAADPPELAQLARDAVKRIGQLAEGGNRERVAKDAAALLERLPQP
jgi:tetratricopeptide (TPR) repeat protein